MMYIHLFFTSLLLSFNFINVTAENYDFFVASLGVSDFDKAYQLAMREVSENIRNGVFIAGSGWQQLWTRDSSYAIELGAGLVHPDLAKASLKKSIEKDRGNSLQDVWLQDKCGHFGGWPNLSDAIVGVRGAWSIYLTTGDREWLSFVYNITKTSLERAERNVFDESSGLFLGCSSFMESNSGYPDKYRNNGRLVGKTKALSTNLLHYAGYKLGSDMAKELGQPETEVQELETKASTLREKIRSRLWSSEHGYYSYVEDDNNELLPQMEGLGESLALLDKFETDPARIESIFTNTHRTERGLPCLWPQFQHRTVDGIFDYYHNGRIWPFVQGYWALAAARHKQVAVFAEEFKNLVWLSQQKDTFAEFYELDGKFPQERARQLWSDTGFISTLFHGLFGMEFLPSGVSFSPIKPSSLSLSNTITLRGVRYREMILNIEVHGFGTEISSFLLDGQESQEAFVLADLTGTHDVSITLSETTSDLLSQALEQFPVDIADKEWLQYVAVVLVALLVFVLIKGPIRRICRSKRLLSGSNKLYE